MANNKLQSLTEIFNEKFFRIPDFQRGYSWNIEQFEDFWDDLANLKNGKIHYTGLLTIEPIEKIKVLNNENWKDDLWLFDRGFQAYYLIDGQQRLTTSIILINEILSRFKSEEGINFSNKNDWMKKFLFLTYNDTYKSYIFGYEKDNPSDEYFKTRILGQESSTSDKVPEQTLYTANLKAAKDFFKKNLSNYKKEDLERIFKKLTSKFNYNVYEIDNDLDVYITFETMNNRGKPLSTLELLKNRFIYLSTLLEIDDSLKRRLRDDINETWKTIYEYLGKNKENIKNDDEFLRDHWIMYFNYDRKQSGAYAKYLLKNKFTAKNAINEKINLNDIKDYIDSLSKSVKSWFYLFNPQFSPYEFETKEWLHKLNRIGMTAFSPLIMASMNKCDQDEFLPLLKAAERFIFLVFKLSQRPSNTKNSHFYRLANKFYFGRDEMTIQSVISEVNRMTSGESGEGDEYEYHGWFDIDKFHNYIKDQYEKGYGFYSWNGLRYFLYEYELDLQEKAVGANKLNWSNFNGANTIEHIYPQTPKDKCWTTIFDRYTKKQKNIILNSLGNLVPLAKSKNSELQNKCFDFKVKHENKKGNEVGFFNGSYSEIEVAGYSPDWTPQKILKRGEKMLEFLERRWCVDFDECGEDDIDKAAFLGLKFLQDNRR